MTSDQIFVAIAIIVPLALAFVDRMRMEVAALLIAAVLGVAQFLGMATLGAPNTPSEANRVLIGLSQPVIMTLFSLFILTRALDRTGVTRLIARRVLAIGGTAEPRLIVLLALTTALLSLFMNNLAAGALLIPSALDISRRTGIHPSKLLIPVSFGSLLGGIATYFTTANIIASDLLTTANPPQAPLNIFDFTPVGGLIALVGIVLIGLLGPKLLPTRAIRGVSRAVRRSGSELEDLYAIHDRLWEVRIKPESPLAGKRLDSSDIGDIYGVTVIGSLRSDGLIHVLEPDESLRPSDPLVVVGREDRIIQLRDQGTVVESAKFRHVSKLGVAFAEAILAPHSGAVGKTLKELNFRQMFGLTVVAILKRERSYRTKISGHPLESGDSLLLAGSRNAIRALPSTRDFIVIESDFSDETIDKRQAVLASAVMVGTVLASIFGMPVYLAALLGALILILSGVITMPDIFASMEWPALYLVAGMYAASIALLNTGLAGLIGQQVVTVVEPFGPLGLAAGVYLLSAALTQVMGGQVTMLVTGPVAISAAISLGVNPQAIAVAAAIGCSASFLTPISHPVNIMVMGPGGYRFRDFARMGWVLLVSSFIMLMFGLKLFWGL